MKVLIAEDNELLRKSLSYFLSSKGFDLSEFDNGSQAIESLGQQKYDLIITDINLPGASGMEIRSLFLLLPTLRKSSSNLLI